MMVADTWSVFPFALHFCSELHTAREKARTPEHRPGRGYRPARSASSNVLLQPAALFVAARCGLRKINLTLGPSRRN
jgi:hypothetical protein